jgi:hemolysin III
MDQAAIFLLIAGLLHAVHDAAAGRRLGLGHDGAGLGLGAGGRGRQAADQQSSERFWCGVYIAFGWVALIAPSAVGLGAAVGPGAAAAGAGDLHRGGVAVPGQGDAVPPAIWHGFVVVAAGVQQAAIWTGVVLAA